MGYGLLGGTMSAVLFLALLPVFEYVFNCLTVFRLRELTGSTPSSSKAQGGSARHLQSLHGGGATCGSVRGQPRRGRGLCPRGGLYHDVGKLHQPEYFTENQGEYNLHDELTPELFGGHYPLAYPDGTS
ncbi:MAG: hypothetical protein ACLS4Z_00880 [Christensenellaceae bacterium]